MEYILIHIQIRIYFYTCGPTFCENSSNPIFEKSMSCLNYCKCELNVVMC